MKCGVITFHRAQNYGAVLQTYALQQAIIKRGVECEVIDYRCPFIEQYFLPWKITSFNSLKRLIATFLFNGQISSNRIGFDEFIINHLKTSQKVYNNKNELEESNDIYDIFITGSDQVWNYLTAGFDKSFFLDFVHEHNKKNSYSASFGVETIPSELKPTYKVLLEDFNHISVREKQGVKIVEELLDFKPPVVLDPTLLLDSDEWRVLDSQRYIGEKYLLVYLIAESKEILKLAKEIAKERNLEIKYINDRIYKTPKMDNLTRVSVNDWISLFSNASIIVTNSFHGVAFSVNFKKEFYMQYLPEPAKVNSRLRNILELFNLHDRNIKNINDVPKTQPINYNLVTHILNEERNKSTKYILNMLSFVE